MFFVPYQSEHYDGLSERTNSTVPGTKCNWGKSTDLEVKQASVQLSLSLAVCLYLGKSMNPEPFSHLLNVHNVVPPIIFQKIHLFNKYLQSCCLLHPGAVLSQTLLVSAISGVGHGWPWELSMLQWVSKSDKHACLDGAHMLEAAVIIIIIYSMAVWHHTAVN